MLTDSGFVQPMTGLSRFFQRWQWFGLLAFMCMLLSACGGSGSPPGSVSGVPVTGGNSNAAPSMRMVLQNDQGQASNGLSLDSPLTAQVTLLDGAGSPLANTIVDFSVGANLAVITPPTGSTLTDSRGIATVRLQVKDAQTAQTQVGAADTLRATATVSAKAVSASAVFQLVASTGNNTGSASLSLLLQDQAGNSSRVASLDSPLVVQAKLVDSNNQPLPNVIVNFTTGASFAVMVPQAGNAVTNAQGIANVTLAPRDIGTAQTQSGAADTVRANAVVSGRTVSAEQVYQVGASSTSNTSASLSLALVNAQGQPASAITPGGPLTAKATLRNASGQPLSGAMVTFATIGNIAALAPASGNTLTDANGVASITISPKDLATALAQAGSADTLRASATIGSTALIASSNFQLGAAGVTLALAAPVNGSLSLNAYDTTLLKVDVLVNGVLYTQDPITVNFSSGCTTTGRATLPATAVTNNGRAQVLYSDRGCAGTDLITASFPGAAPVNASLQIAPPVAASLGFVSATPLDQAIVIKGAGGAGRSETATLSFVALDTAGKPLQNELINFAVNSTQPVTLQTTSATTDSQGRVTANVSSGNLPTTFRVIASFANNPAISTISSVMTVSNGIPTQAAFSLSVANSNIEGWSIDGVNTTVGIRMADASGNPVVDGTPVVFQTDSGAIGSSTNGGCTTINGACSVSFTSQNPRYSTGNTAGKRAGLATITASSSTALVSLTGQTAVFLSGGFATQVYLTANGARMGGQTNLTANSCGLYSLDIEVNDENLNPMPFGTKISITDANSEVTLGSVIPASVFNVSPRDAQNNPTLQPSLMRPRQGTNHTIPITLSSSCNTAGSKTKTGTFNIKIASPQGNETVYGVNLSYQSD